MDKVLNYYETMDYDKFHFFSYNRTVGSNKQLANSMETLDMTECVPIIVNPEFYIIDGQNRFLRCKEKGKPIYYIIFRGDAELAMIVLNTAQKPWKQADWLNYYCKKGDERYIKLKRLYESNSSMGLSNAVLLFSQAGTNAKTFRQGNLIDRSELFTDVVDYINGLDVPKDVRWYRAFVNAVLNFFQRNAGDGKKLLKLSKKISAITKFSRVEDYEMAFENWTRKKG